MSVILDGGQISSETYTLCCCCLELPCSKSLWTEHKWMGHTEVYGLMLKECFDLTWPHTVGAKLQICEFCITQLRSAAQFKEKVVQSQTRLRLGIKDMTPIKQEKSDLMHFTQDPLSTESTIIDKEILMPDEKNIESLKNDDDDDDGGICDEAADNHDGCNDDANSLKREEMNKQSTEVNKANKNHGKVRKKRKKRLLIKSKDKKRSKIEFRKINYMKPRQNACLILENSNLVPFRFTKGYFTCFYCNKQHICFDDLKTHVKENHNFIGFKDILKSILRPHERVKADVSNIICKICNKNIENVEYLITHLKENHDVNFNYDSEVKPIDSILPFDLSDGKFKCYLCKSEFMFFKTLSFHMNTHSNNYVCDICGRCFLLPERLRAHTQSHNDGKSIKCEFCDKICSTAIILRSHIIYAHKKRSFLCSICNETFSSYRLRIKHLEIVHNRFFNLSCDICSKKYLTPNSLNNHVRKDHMKMLREAKYSCSVCGRRFVAPNALACHSVVHTGEKKFHCEVCNKKYARAKSLAEHLKIHSNDRRWSCGGCGQAFIQKCSLKKHIRNHHVESDCEQLIVYKKPDVE